jgi:hypothetical protein
MSITTHHSDTRPRSQTYTCKRDACRGVVTPGAAIEGYCSHECQLRAQGQRLLNLVKHDHRFCYTCFRQLKEVHDVPAWRRRRLDPVTESVVTGYQSRTEHAQLGERREQRPGTLPDDTRRGTICECGQTSHRDREGLIQSSNIKTVARNLYATLETLGEEGQHSSCVEYLPLVRVLYAQYQHDPGYDFPTAVALATTDGES